MKADVAARDAPSEIDTGCLLHTDIFRTRPSEPIAIAVINKTDKAAVTPIYFRVRVDELKCGDSLRSMGVRRLDPSRLIACPFEWATQRL